MKYGVRLDPIESPVIVLVAPRPLARGDTPEMPRARLPPSLHTKPARPIEPKDGPRIWNAKRRIKASIGLTPEQFKDFKQTPPHVWFTKYRNLQAEESQDAERASSMLQTPLDEAVIEETMTEEGELEWWKLDREHLDKFMDAHPQLRHVSSDVRTFISENSHAFEKSEILQILRSPVRYFSAASNVPLAFRKQVYL